LILVLVILHIKDFAKQLIVLIEYNLLYTKQ